MGSIKASSREFNGPAIFLIISIAFSFYYLDIGFALKPYMVLLILIFLLSLKKFVIHKLIGFETALIIFYMYYCSTGFFAKYPAYSLRLIAGVFLTLFCYFVMRYVFSRASIKGIEKGISYGGFVFNGLSLLLYTKGLFALNFVLIGNQIKVDGLMMDRNSPRLIGMTNDPNIFCFYNLIFFFYYLTHLDKKWSKIGVVLSGMTMLLTLSRGGIIAIIIGLGVMFLTTNLRGKLKILFTFPIVLFILDFLTKTLLQIDVSLLIKDRFLTNDGGSGRLDLWSNGLYFFKDNPVFGIGIFNYRPYSERFFGRTSFMHNTYLEVMTEGGLLGIALYSLIFFAVIVAYFKNRYLINDNRFLFITFISIIILMSSLSMVVNEIFFLVLALIWRYLLEIKNNQKANTVTM